MRFRGWCTIGALLGLAVGSGLQAQDPVQGDTAAQPLALAPPSWTRPLLALPEEPGPDFRRDVRSFRNSFNVVGLYGQDLGVGGKLSLDLLATPHFGFRLGGFGFSSDTVVAAFGSAGFVVPVSTGRVRFKLHAGGFGGLQAKQTSAFYDPIQIRNPDGSTSYLEIYSDTLMPSFGVMGGAEVRLIIGPGLNLDLGGGLLKWLHEEGADRAPVPFLTAGLGWSFRSQPFFMTRHDARPPQVVLLEPAPAAGQAVRMPERRVEFSGVVASWTPIQEVRVGGRSARVVRLPVKSEDPELPLTGRRYSFSATLDLPRDRVADLDVVATDQDGRTSTITVALAPPVDSVGPLMGLSTPGFEPDSISGVIRVPPEGAAVDLRAELVDASGVARVMVNGRPTVLSPPPPGSRDQPPGQRRYRFAIRVEPQPGYSSVALVIQDSLGNETSHEVRFERPVTAVAAVGDSVQETQITQVDVDQAPAETGAGPMIQVMEPVAWTGEATRGFAAEARRSIRVVGQVRHMAGIRQVLINGMRASLAMEPGGVSGRFMGFAPIEDDTRAVRISAVGGDGAISERTFPVNPAPAPPPAPDRTWAGDFRGQRWAVVIGVSDYLDPEIPDLQYADADARAVYDFLLSQRAGLGGFQEDHVRLLVNEEATTRAVRGALGTFLKNSTEDDVIFIYIAGHGTPDPERLSDLYILTYDTELTDLAGSAVEMDYVYDAVDRAYALNKVLFTDACHSAGMGVAATRGLNENQVNAVFLQALRSSTGGFVAFTASEAAQLSQEGEQWGGHGVYTYFLLRGLEGEADEDGNGIVELGELMEYTRSHVMRETHSAQIPMISLTSFDRFWPMAVRIDGPGGE